MHVDIELLDSIPLLENRRILLGVTGSIAAFKVPVVASALTQYRSEVTTILTGAAQRFVSPLTFTTLTGRNAYVDDDLWGKEGHVIHVRLAENADLLLIAPATANTIAKLARGEADTLLTIAALATRAPLLVAPAMDAGMYEHPATQENINILRQRGAEIVGPVSGRMASGLVGLGRMVEPPELVGHIRRVLGKRGPLAGRKVVVTAGGTREFIDPARVLTNRSSGKQGFALAQAAIDKGAQVTLISGPSYLPTPVGAERINVVSSAQMRDAVMEQLIGTDALLMAAAVSDFRIVEPSEAKIKRHKGVPELALERTEDILALVAATRKAQGWPRAVIGFAAESQDIVANARGKLGEKHLSMIVANDITAVDAGFDVDTNRVTIIHEDEGVEELPLMTKSEVADIVLAHVVRFLS